MLAHLWGELRLVYLCCWPHRLVPVGLLVPRAHAHLPVGYGRASVEEHPCAQLYEDEEEFGNFATTERGRDMVLTIVEVLLYPLPISIVLGGGLCLGFGLVVGSFIPKKKKKKKKHKLMGYGERSLLLLWHLIFCSYLSSSPAPIGLFSLYLLYSCNPEPGHHFHDQHLQADLTLTIHTQLASPVGCLHQPY
ncbi:hypothetical protein NE237_018915 [Protea cynaroides]|uniref:Uncharacterized protein n=1 Tax=Protea cynaroides TaxID=273540 RepID=A0A9Q0KAZ9_9MAGN|nr:hypothetical protein NE237_018915 [Protea cynaroides]